MTIPRQDFENFWSRLQREISVRDTVRNWTKDNGYRGGSFTIHKVDSGFVKIKTPNADKPQRLRKKDFETIYDLWDAYNNGDVPRNELRDITPYKSKYIISILKHLM